MVDWLTVHWEGEVSMKDQLACCLPCPAGVFMQWIALVASAEFFCNDVQNEPLAEQLRERVR